MTDANHNKHLKDYLTTEPLRNHFNSGYDLVNYSIQVAKEMINKGLHLDEMSPDIKNTAYLILDRVVTGDENLEELRKLIAEAADREEDST